MAFAIKSTKPPFDLQAMLYVVIGPK